MDSVIFSVNTVFPLFFVGALGFYMNRKGVLDKKAADTMSSICFRYLIPVMLFKEVRSSEILADFSVRLVVFCVAGILASAAIATVVWPIFLKDRARCGAAIHSSFRTNFLLLGIPLVTNMFGEAGTATAAMVLPFVVILYNILAVTVFTAFGPDTGEKQGLNPGKLLVGIVKNPLIWGILLGLSFQLLRLPLPGFASKTVDYLGNMASPLALLAVGGQFDIEQAVKNLKLSTTLTALRVVVIPLVLTGVAILFGFRGQELATIYVLFGSPTAVSGAPMAKAMGSDAQLTGEVTMLTSFFSCFTFFMGISILRGLGMF